MSSTYTDRVNGVATHVAVKAPCRVATSGPIDLWGLQVVDGVQVADGDRVIVRQQPDPRDNGIYVAHEQDWIRAIDMDGGRDVVNGTFVLAVDGPVGVGQRLGAIWRVSSVETAPIVGKHPLTFTYTPEDATAAAAVAASQAAAASAASAATAEDAAISAAASAAASGAGSQRAWGPYELIDGVQVYGPLPIKPPTADAIEMDVDGLSQPLHPIGAPQAWTITNEHGPGLSVTLTAPVRKNPGPGELQAGLPIYGTVLGGITDNAIGNKTILGRHIADGAIDFSGAMIKAGPANMWMRTDSAGRVVYDTIPDVLKWTSVQDYGAVGGGVADNTAAIRAAGQAMDNPGVLYFPPTPGGYGISDTIELEKAGCVMGMPNASKIVPLTPDKDIFRVTQPYTHIEGLLFDSPAGFRTGGTTIKVTTGNISRIKLCEFRQQFNAIWVTDAFGATIMIDGCGIYFSAPGAGTCIRIDSGYNVGIRDTLISNLVDAMPAYGIYISAAGDVELQNTMVLCCQYGLNVYVPAGKVLASLWAVLLSCDNCGRGASLIADGGAIVRSSFTNGWFSSAHSDDGFFVATANGGALDGVALNNCEFYDCLRNGLTVYTSTARNIDITASRAAYNRQSGFAMGIVPGAPALDWSISDSLAGAGYGWPGNGSYGIFAAAGADGYRLGGNRLRGNGLGPWAGIDATRPTVYGNLT